MSSLKEYAEKDGKPLLRSWRKRVNTDAGNLYYALAKIK
jgi:hypothetical protein